MISPSTATTKYKHLSMSSTKSAIPNIVERPASPETSLKANLSFASLMTSPSNLASRKTSVAASTRSSKMERTTTDQFEIYSSADEAGPDEEIAAHTLADFIQYPNDPLTTIKSPAARHHFRSGSISLGYPSEAASFATSSSAQRDGSTRAIKSPRGSASEHGGDYATSDVVPSPDARKRSAASGASNSSPDGFPASEAVATNDEADSPTLGKFPRPPTTTIKRGKARNSMLLSRYPQDSESPAKRQKERTSMISIQDPEVTAERGLGISFLPKFLKGAGSPRQSVSAAPQPQRDSMEITEVDEIPPKEQNAEGIKSTFESDSSDEEAAQPYGKHTFIGGAKLAAMHKPNMIESRRSGGRRVVSMQDILNEGGMEELTNNPHRRGASVPAEGSASLAPSKASHLLGEKSIKLKRAGIVGMPAVHEAARGVQASPNHKGERVKGQTDEQVRLTDGLRSNPVKEAATALADREVVLPTKSNDEQRTAKDSVVLTPYPPGYNGKDIWDEDSVARPGSGIDHGKRAIKDQAKIMLILYSRNSNTPTIRKLVVPETTKASISDEDEKKPPFRAKITLDFDDEKLFRLIKKEYRGMRGVFKGLASARTVHGISLLGYHRLSQLAVKEHKPNRRKTFRVYEDIFTEQRLMDLWTAPDRGRKKHEWVEWIRQLPRDSEGLHPDEENVALELVEGWGVGKIGFAVVVVVILSMLATLLWTFLGIDGGVVLQKNAMIGFPVELRMNSAGFRGASMRVGTGLALGVLVLLLGWTGVGVWVILSWLAM